MVLQLELLGRDASSAGETAETLRRRRDLLQREVGRLRQGLERLLAVLVPSAVEEDWTARGLLDELGALTAPLARHHGLSLEVAAPSDELRIGGGCRPIRGLLLAILTTKLLELAGTGATLALRAEGGAGRVLITLTVGGEEVRDLEEHGVDDEPGDRAPAPGAPVVDELVAEVLGKVGGTLERGGPGVLVVTLPQAGPAAEHRGSRCRAS